MTQHLPDTPGCSGAYAEVTLTNARIAQDTVSENKARLRDGRGTVESLRISREAMTVARELRDAAYQTLASYLSDIPECGFKPTDPVVVVKVHPARTLHGVRTETRVEFTCDETQGFWHPCDRRIMFSTMCANY